MSSDLFEPLQLGDLRLANRMVMAPMTRNRADGNGLATALMVTYYRQRASAGLIITESAPISPEGVGYPGTPLIHSNLQAQAWRQVTEAVHSTGGLIFIQLQHCGRISHPSLLPNNATPVAPSALAPEGKAITYSGLQDFVIPRALATDEIASIVVQFRHGAQMAQGAGFDGVEVHGANGYLIDQFLRDGSNHRTDAYGGSVHSRMRLLDEVLDAVCSVWPAHRVGLRLTPENRFNSMSDTNPQAHFEYFLQQLSPRRLAYVHVLEGDMMTRSHVLDYRALRSKFTGPYIANNGYDLERAQSAIRGGEADLVAFGIPFLANPDLPRRYRENLPLNKADHSSFYGGAAAGYTDYPCYPDEDVKTQGLVS
jgi:N-ethylmaleimide reductase